MKRIIPLIVILSCMLLIILILNSSFAVGQIDKSKILTSESSIPIHWEDSLTNKPKWVLVQIATVKNGKVKEITSVKNKTTIRYFQKDSTIILPAKIDTAKKLAIKYFQSEKTFYASTRTEEGHVLFVIPYKVIYLNGNYLVLEDFFLDLHFDVATGKILSDEEVKKRAEEDIKAHGKKLFHGIRIGGRKNKTKYFEIYKAE